MHKNVTLLSFFPGAAAPRPNVYTSGSSAAGRYLGGAISWYGLFIRAQCNFEKNHLLVNSCIHDANPENVEYNCKEDRINNPVLNRDFNEFITGSAKTLGMVTAYRFAVYAWVQTTISIFCDAPAQRAMDRGYRLK